MCLPAQNLAVVLRPQQAVVLQVRYALGSLVNPKISDDDTSQEENSFNSQRYLCAMISPGALVNAYEIHLWRQVVINISTMDAEVLLEYDTATRGLLYYNMMPFSLVLNMENRFRSDSCQLAMHKASIDSIYCSQIHVGIRAR
jgi:hypothetical protein